MDEDYSVDDEAEEATHEALDTASLLFREPSPDELSLLKEMKSWAERAIVQIDAKTKGLIRWLNEHIRPGGKWADERVIIFTEYRATQNWLQGVLAAEGLTGGERLLTMYGGMESKDRERIKAAFQTDPKQSSVRILLATDAASAEPVRKLFKFERDLAKQIKALTDKLNETRRELRLEPENVQKVVVIALELAGQPPLEEAKVHGLWPDSQGHYRPTFRLPALSGSWEQCAEGLAHPFTGAARPFVFDHASSKGREDVVLVHVNHRLVQMSLRLMRAEIWALEGQKKG